MIIQGSAALDVVEKIHNVVGRFFDTQDVKHGDRNHSYVMNDKDAGEYAIKILRAFLIEIEREINPRYLRQQSWEPECEDCGEPIDDSCTCKMFNRVLPECKVCGGLVKNGCDCSEQQ